MRKNDKKKTKETKPVKDKAYYKEIFDQFWEQYNYIPVCGIHGDVEHLIELNDSYPEYWFATSHGRVFSAYGGKVKQLQPNHVLAGRSRNENKWYYIQGDGKHRYIHQIVAEHCCENPWGDDVKVEVHHITPTKKFGADDAFIANQAGNLQWLPKKIHDTVGYFAKKEPEDIFEEKMAKAPIEIQIPDLTEWFCSMVNTGAVQGLKLYKYEDLKENQFREHDVSCVLVKNPHAKLTD